MIFLKETANSRFAMCPSSAFKFMNTVFKWTISQLTLWMTKRLEHPPTILTGQVSWVRNKLYTWKKAFLGHRSTCRRMWSVAAGVTARTSLPHFTPYLKKKMKWISLYVVSREKDGAFSFPSPTNFLKIQTTRIDTHLLSVSCVQEASANEHGPLPTYQLQEILALVSPVF